MRQLLLPCALAVLLGGCPWISDAEEAARLDLDLDQVPRPQDCDDSDPKMGSKSQWYRDTDGDGFGAFGTGIRACEAPPGFVQDGGDCDDTAFTTNPSAFELCDGIDNNCDSEVDNEIDFFDVYADFDGDGFGDPNQSQRVCDDIPGYLRDAGDCNDDPANEGAAFHPGASEVCNGLDDDCDNLYDLDDDSLDLDTARWYLDADGDGYGDPAFEDITCTPQSGYVMDDTDCNDLDEDISPASDEWCDAIDNDCDGVIDPDLAVNAPIWYDDVDGDGFGDPSSPAPACYRPVGKTDFTVARDCDDFDPAIHPAAAEICDGIDNDCDFREDDDDPKRVDGPYWYFDSDGDGFGDQAFGVQRCLAPTSYVDSFSDCDDTDATINPDATETCDTVDNDCDDLVDDQDNDLDPTQLSTFFLDQDGDGFGNPVQPYASCSPPSGYVDDNTDCNDFTAATSPTAPEICDGIDNDCDGLQDDGVEIPIWYPDLDGDGFGNGVGNQSCTALTGHSALDGDCDDGDEARNPGQSEICDNKDNDCDGSVDQDDDDLIADRWYADLDNDGYGDANDEQISCSQPSDYVADDRDCDDGEAALNPGQTEVCDGIDNDCDDLVDDIDPTLSATTYWPDQDGDGFGASDKPSVVSCTQPADYAPSNDDCDDLDSTLHPNGPEICDGIDNDCDDEIDDDDPSLALVSGQQGYSDTDGDGFGDPASPVGAPTCIAQPGLVFDNTDCDDGEEETYPGAPELCDDVDNDCDNIVIEPPEDWYLDADGDGFGDPTISQNQCTPDPGYVFFSTDCDDSDPDKHPDAPEVCDSIDNDCDSHVDDDDDNVLGFDWFADFDQDGFGTFRDHINACIQPPFYDDDDLDCDDIQAIINPDATEFCDNIDNDCDGLQDDQDPDIADADLWHLDSDGDTFGNGLFPVVACDQPEFHTLDGADCDDTNPAIFPGAVEMCDTVDNDCNLLVDDTDGGVFDQINWYVDNDGDGFGDGVVNLVACFQPDDHSSVNSDCNDSDALTYPGAPERCDGNDNDCDTFADSPLPENRDWYLDADGDGWGDPNVSILTCDPQPGYVLTDADCDDNPITGPDVYPGAEEICDDGIDNDCDGLLDGDDGFAVGGALLYEDADGDGFGNPDVQIGSCSAVGFVEDNTDCDDGNPSTYPAAPASGLDVEDGIDRDCDGLDECLIDVDGDGFYGNTTQPDDGDGLCDGPSEGRVVEDCDDNFVGGAIIFPGAPIDATDVGDGVDRNCDGAEECFQDADLDGAGDTAGVVFDGDVDLLCDTAGESYTRDDCDDLNDTVYPLSPEYCGDGIDNNCNFLDEDSDPAPVPVTWWLDRDGDGFGGGIYSIVSCAQPEAFVLDDTDCDDENTVFADRIYPGAPELCDLVDNDCDNRLDGDDSDYTGPECSPLPSVDEAFTCHDIPDFGLHTEDYGWESTWPSDNWTSESTNGVSNQTVSANDLLGTGGDAENFLVTGHSTWDNSSVQTRVVADSGAFGVVVRYASSASYYACRMTNSDSPGCTTGAIAGPRVLLSRVSDDPCTGNDDYTVDEAPFSYTPSVTYGIQLSVSINAVTCLVDTDDNGIFSDPGDIALTYVDPDPLPPGLIGLSAWNLNNGIFDDVLATVTDGDVDKDGLPNITEAILGLSFLSADSDADTIADVHEVLMAQRPPNTDGDAQPNSLDKDSDGDGISDEAEAGDRDLFTSPVDNDCDGLPDYMDTDSDGDGFPDDIDNCRTIENDQLDGDSDGLGESCDSDDGNNDIDNDGLLDGLEVAGGTDLELPDTDGDGLLDGEEQLLGTNKLFSDSDADGLSDYNEVVVYFTNPLDNDTDGGGAKDGEEVDAGTDPVSDPLDD